MSGFPRVDPLNLPLSGGTMTGPIVGFQDKGGQVFNVKAYGAKGDGIARSDGAITTGTAAFTSATGTFTSADVGKLISVNGAGTSGAVLVTTISAYTSATAVTLAANAATTVSGATYLYATEDATSVNAAITACQNAGGGIVEAPPGLYVTNVGFTVPSSQTHVIVKGAGELATTFKAISSAYTPNQVFLHQSNGWVQDCTFDGNGANTEALEMSNPSAQTAFKIIQGAFRVTAQNAKGSWVMVVWDRNQTFQIDRFYFDKVTIKGPGNTAGDNFTVSYVNTCFVKDLTFDGLARTPNFYYANQLFIDGLYSNGVASTGAVVIDVGVLKATISNLQIIPSGSAANGDLDLNCAFAELDNIIISSSTVPGNLVINASGTSGVGKYRLSNFDIPNGHIAISQPIQELSLSGGYIYNQAGDSIVVDGSAASSTTGLVRLSRISGNGFNGVQPICRSSNAVTWTTFQMSECDVVNLSTGAFTNITLGTGSSISKVKGYNPRGGSVTQPAVAASGTAVTNNTGVDCTVFVNGGTVSAIAIGGTATGLTSGSFRVPAGQTITLSYSVAPTWTWFGD